LEIKKMEKVKDFYELLGVGKECSKPELKKAYRKLALKFHPDKNRTPGAQGVFKKIATAYDCLNNEDKRATYDRYGNEEPEQHFRHYRQHYREDVSPDVLLSGYFQHVFRGRRGLRQFWNGGYLWA
jgi:DnaJ family protein B protein 12